jgi:hypothetical protein
MTKAKKNTPSNPISNRGRTADVSGKPKKEPTLAMREKAWKTDRGESYVAALKPLSMATNSLYLLCMREFDAQCQKEGLSLEAFIQQAVKSTKSKVPSNNYRPPLYHVYYLLNVKAENVVRTKYYLKTIQDHFFYDQYNEALERALGDPFKKILDEQSGTIAPLEGVFSNKLDQIYVNRWIDYYTDLEQYIDETNWKEKFAFINSLPLPADTTGGAHKLYHSAARFFKTYDPLAAVRFYLRYLYADRKEVKNKQFNRLKKTYGAFFTTQKQLDAFVQIATDLLKDDDLETALAASETIFGKKFTAVQLDQTAIEKVAGRHAQTVQVLNKYLAEEEGAPAQTPASQSNLLKPVQLQLLELLHKNNFTITSDELNRFAKKKGVLKNQLIKSINDACHETIGDVLIEEITDGYEMLEKYYKKIIP